MGRRCRHHSERGRLGHATVSREMVTEVDVATALVLTANVALVAPSQPSHWKEPGRRRVAAGKRNLLHRQPELRRSISPCP